MSKIYIFGTLSNVYMLLNTVLYGAYVGVDQFGNKYYKRKPRKGTKQERRWVMYKDEIEASLVPPEWHGWLHHQTDVVPAQTNRHRKDWIRPHRPNLTGTDQAYLPPALKGQPRAAATGDYVSWTPPQ